MRLEIWWDPVCPWCYLGLLDLRTALNGTSPADRPTIVWRAFQLDPAAGEVGTLTALDVMAQHEPRRIVLERLMRVETFAAVHGVRLATQTARPTNTFDAHRVALLAQDRGRFDEFADQLLRAYHTDNQNIADHAVLAQLAQAAGLDGTEVAEILSTTALADRVTDDLARAQRHSISGVPTVLLDGRHPRNLRDWLATGARADRGRSARVNHGSTERQPPTYAHGVEDVDNSPLWGQHGRH